jgi:hypothetical protein
LLGASLSLVLLTGLAIARPARGQPAPGHCGVEIPSHEALGFVPLPRGDLFCPLIADPKSLHSFASYQREESSPLDADVGAVGVADRFGMLRWGGPRPGEGLQLSLSGGVFAQFDLNSASYDLINADYVVGLPLTFRRGGFSSRLRLYHQSSHLGDEFLLREGLPTQRENLSFESVELLLSQDRWWLRLYAGGENLFLEQPTDFAPLIAHGGLELRPGGHLFNLGNLGSVHFLAALDVKAAEEQDWTPAWSARGGFQVVRPHNGGEPGRGWSLLFEYYDGPSPYGQFYRDYLRFIGLGLHFMG